MERKREIEVSEVRVEKKDAVPSKCVVPIEFVSPSKECVGPVSKHMIPT